MMFYCSRIAILLCMLVSVATIGILLSKQVKSEGESQRHIEPESQPGPRLPDTELRVPTTLQSVLQEGDLTTWHTAEELRLPNALRTFLQQSDPLTSGPYPSSQ